jgi:hypothetical protein
MNRSAGRLWPEAEFCGHSHQVRERVGLHLSHHFAAVGLYGNFPDADLTAGLFAPVKLIVIEEDQDRSSLTYVRPPSLMVVDK